MLKTFSGRSNAQDGYKVLEVLQANVMVADAKLNIIYMNPAVQALLQENEADLRKELPNFSVAKLIGSNIDVFHKNPTHQRTLLARLTGAYSATIRIGSLAFDLLVTPQQQGGKVVGFVVEWADAKARLLNVDYAAQIAAISRSQAVIEFNVDGTIINANDNFSADHGLSAGRGGGAQACDVHRTGLSRQPGVRRLLGAAGPRRISGRRVHARGQGRRDRDDPGLLQPDPRQRRKGHEDRQVRHRRHQARLRLSARSARR
ncbi:PAS domain-containing protein [Caulobacter segnis]